MLDNNQITTVAANAFAGLNNLTALSLKTNKIDALVTDAFQGLSSLKQLILTYNAIQSMDAGCFAGLPDSMPDVTINNLEYKAHFGNPYGVHIVSNPCPTYIAPGALSSLPIGITRTLAMNNIPSQASACLYNLTAKMVTCRCAVDRFNDLYPQGPRLFGGQNGWCVCPPGQYASHIGGIISCSQCEFGYYSNVSGAFSCDKCPLDYTNFRLGSRNSSDCEPDPRVQAANARLQVADALVREQEATSETDKKQKDIYLIAGIATVAVVVLLFAVTKNKQHLAQTENLLRDAEIRALQFENRYLRDWRIPCENITFDRRLAAGTEGEVWTGKLHGHLGEVAIKRALLNPVTMDEENATAVWDEREVSFMMSIQHPRLVTFLGAGEIADERSHGYPVLFMVQEFMSGGSIDRRYACF